MSNGKQRWAKVLEYCEAATEGPWDDDGDGFSVNWRQTEGKIVAVLEMIGDCGYSGCDHRVVYKEPDGHFIINARTDLPDAARIARAAEEWWKHTAKTVRVWDSAEVLDMLDAIRAGCGPRDV